MRRRAPVQSAPTQESDALRRLRLLVRIALMYHRGGMSQSDVARRLHLSQARVSQLLKAAEEQRIVETVVHVPSGMFAEIEAALEQRYDLQEAVVLDPGVPEPDLRRALGEAAAPHVRSAIEGAEVVGVAAWSETLHAAVQAMQPLPAGETRFVVNVFGGFGPSSSQAYSRLVQRLAELCGARAAFLLGPGVVASAEVREALANDPQLQEVVSLYDRLAVLLVGIGALQPNAALRDSGYVSAEDRDELRVRGAVGDIALHFFDARGRRTPSSLDERILGISYEQLERTPRKIAIAGGRSKHEAIHAALLGSWVDTLITDLATAEWLLKRA